MRVDITCPVCRQSFDLEQARNDGDWRELVQAIMALPEFVHRPMWQYLGLFQGKQKLRSIKMLRIVNELAPMIKAATLSRNHVEYVVTAQQFARAMEYLVDTRPASLVLPLKSNGYMLGMLVNQAEQQLTREEVKKDEQLRNRVQDGPVQAPQPIMDAVEKPRSRSGSNNEKWKHVKKHLGARSHEDKPKENTHESE